MQEVRAKRGVGIHFGTFPLGDEAQDAPPADLASAVAAAGLPANEFVALQHGAMLRTARGKDLNSPPLLPVMAAAHRVRNAK